MSELVTIRPGQRAEISTPHSFLKVIAHTGDFDIGFDGQTPDKGAVDVYQIGERIERVFFINNGSVDVDVEYEITEILSMGRSSISGVATVQVEGALPVTADATVEDGKMRKIVSGSIITPQHLSVTAGHTVALVSARDNTNRLVTVQNISDEWATVAVSGNSSMTDSEGLLLAGDIDSIATLTIENTSALYVRNLSAVSAKVAVTEEFRV